MLDIKFIHENADKVKEAAKNKNIDPKLIDELLGVDEKRRELMQKTEEIRAAQKKTQDREEGARLKAEFKEGEERLKPLEAKFEELMVRMPTVPSPDTPVGKSEADNKEIYKSGEPKKFDFEPKDHIELGTHLGILDFHRRPKLAG